jgi:D-serine deaminase-like pyridoxal phosphate-dependent protein
MADHCRQTKRGFRPHAKTHKCPEIARRQIAAGALGICAATVPEAEALVAAGIRGVLLTSPIVDPGRIARMVALARTEGAVMMAIGNARSAQLLAEAAEAARVNIDVLVDIDIGDRRTGSLPGEPAVELAKQIARSQRLNIRGVQAYAGHASHTIGFDARQKVSRESMGKAVDTRALLERAGFDAKILSGGSTGTYNIDSHIDGVTELQVGFSAQPHSSNYRDQRRASRSRHRRCWQQGDRHHNAAQTGIQIRARLDLHQNGGRVRRAHDRRQRKIAEPR